MIPGIRAALATLAITVLAAAAARADQPPVALAVEAGYIGDTFRVARGGLGTGSRYLDDAYVTLGARDAFGRDGLTLFAHALYNNGAAVSGDLVGDAQGISNIEAVRSARLFEAWADYAPAPGHSVRVGLYDLNSEFDVGEARSLFLHGSHGMGPELSQTGAATFPVSALAARYRREARRWYLQAAVLEGTPGDPDNPRSNAVKFQDGEGVLLAGEAGLASGPLHKLALGLWRYTARFPDLERRDARGAPLRRGGNHGAYLMLETGLGRDAADERGRWRAFLRYGVAEAGFNEFGSSFGAGLVRRGGWPRGEGQVGVALARVQTGAPFRNVSRAAGTPAAGHETNLELTWHVPVTDWFTLQPDLQYVIHPGAAPLLRDAWIVGFRFQLVWPIAGN